MNVGVIVANHDIAVLAKPLCLYAIEAAQDAKTLDEILLVSTNEDIIAIARGYGIDTLQSTREKSMIETAAGLNEALTRYDDAKIIVLIAGNTVMVDSRTIDSVVKRLEAKSKWTATLTGHIANGAHPTLVLKPDQHGYLRKLLPTPQSYREKQRFTMDAGARVFVPDQRVIAFRRSNFDTEDGPGRWWFLGKRPQPIADDWPSGRLIESLRAKKLSEAWLRGGKP